MQSPQRILHCERCKTEAASRNKASHTGPSVSRVSNIWLGRCVEVEVIRLLSIAALLLSWKSFSDDMKLEKAKGHSL